MQLSKSPRINLALYTYNIATYKQAIYHLPYRYDDLNITKETGLEDKSRLVIEGRIISTPITKRFRNISVTKFTFFTKNENIFYVEAWNRPYIASNLNREDIFTLIGSYDLKNKKVNLINIYKGEIPLDKKIKPLYSLPKEVENYQFSNIVKKAFEEVTIHSNVPFYFQNKYKLLNKQDSLKLLHFPKSAEDIYKGKRHIKYEECLLFSLKNQLIKEKIKEKSKNEKQHIDENKLNEFISSISYKLTNDQKTALNDIINDMNKTSLMYRLIQGDVGTGKTLVAMLAMYANYLRNDQSAFMAPTDSLARQHFETLVNLFKDTDMKIALLVGQTPLKEKRAIAKGLINHEINIVVGTHALFQEGVDYSSLGLVIIDEQHRFGVNQRLALFNKGSRVDLLLMSATPIPRTLSLTLYGDLDISTIKEFPSGKRNVITSICGPKDKTILKEIDNSIKNNKKVFIIAPAIEESQRECITVEELYKYYLEKYPDEVVLLHGKLDKDDKLDALYSFTKGNKHIIVSTTVIEVGIDVKNANLMIVYDANYFGLASLHQLRGRVGRDGSESKFILVTSSKEEDDLKKLEVLVNTSDGFVIAEEDLKRRGPGEVFGFKQSGIPAFNYVNLIDDFKMLEVARDDASYIIKNKNKPEFAYILNLCEEKINEKEELTSLV